MSLTVTTKRVSHFDQNARIITDLTTNESMIIDPGAEADLLFDMVSATTVTMIVLTHCHIDHAGGVTRLLELFDHANRKRPQLFYHSKDIIIGEHLEEFAKNYGFSATDYQNPPHPDQLMDSLSSIKLGSKTFTVYFTPGHSPGHIVLYYDNDDFKLAGDYSETLDSNRLLIAGDTLFYGSIGRTDLPMGNHSELIQSIKTQLLTLPDTTLVCAGHGPNTTIGNEAHSNPFLN